MKLRILKRLFTWQATVGSDLIQRVLWWQWHIGSRLNRRIAELKGRNP
jgi:hypothetical protein